MKKILFNIAAIVMLLALAFSLCGCEDDVSEVIKPEIKNEFEGYVTVTNIDELIGTIAPDAKILLKAGTYELSSADGYGKDSGAYYEWRDTYDGYELVIRYADGLVICGEDDDSVFVNARSTYANVLTVENSANVTLKDLTVGHTAKPGTCSGGVIMLDNVSDSVISDCKLYGCGIIGVDALQCERINVLDCDIYECSSSAVNANQCTDVRITDCDIHDCGGEYGGSVFCLNGTAGFAVLDCDIENNNVNYMLYASYCPEMYILGCETKDNTIHDAMFCLAGNAPKVEGTTFHENSFTAWYDSSYSPTPGLKCTDRAGNVYKNSQLEAMTHAECSYDGPVIPQITAQPKTVENADGTKTVYVTTADELLAAIAPNTNIWLDTDEIRLFDASNYGSGGGEYYRWEACYDGPQLVIENCNNLSITSETVTHIMAQPRYANVLYFENCENVWLSGFRAGHTVDVGVCSGGVIYMNNCKNMSVDGSFLYGCGIFGVCADYVDGLSITGSEIYDCTQGGVYLYNVKNCLIEGCYIHDCAVPEISVFDCSCVSFVMADGSGMYLPDGSYTIDEKGLPSPWNWQTDEYIEPSLDQPYMNVYIGNALSNTLFLGKDDGTAEISAYVNMPNGEYVNKSQIFWMCEDEGALELDTYMGETVTVKSNLEPGQAAELYIYYLDNGSFVASASVSVFGSRP